MSKLVIYFTLIGVVILLDQFIRFGVLFEVEDFLHHEGIAVYFFGVAIGLLLGMGKSMRSK